MWQHQTIFVSIYSWARITLGAAFVLAGALKLGEPEVLEASISAFGLVPQALEYPLARALPVIEVLLGLGCIAGARLCVHGIALILVIFITVLGYGLHLGLDVDCGCYGPADPMAKALGSMRGALVRDVIMLAVAGLCLFKPFVRSASSSPDKKAPQALLS